MNELASLFKDLSVMVVEQGTVLDRIDYNVQESRQNIKQVNTELVKTLKRETNWRTRGCISCEITWILGLTAVLLMKHVVWIIKSVKLFFPLVWQTRLVATGSEQKLRPVLGVRNHGELAKLDIERSLRSLVQMHWLLFRRGRTHGALALECFRWVRELLALILLGRACVRDNFVQNLLGLTQVFGSLVELLAWFERSQHFLLAWLERGAWLLERGLLVLLESIYS